MGYVLVTLLALAPASQDTSRLTLERAVALALERAPALEAARQSEVGARQNVREAKAQWFPLVSADGSVVRHEEPMLVAPIHSLALTPGAPFPQFDRTLVQGSLGLGWTLFDGGNRSGRIGQASALEDAARARTEDAAQTLMAAVIRSYAEVQAAHEAATAEASRRAALSAEQARVGRFLAEGRAAPLEQLRVNAAVASAEADRASAESRLEVAQARLARLIGIPVDQARAATLDSLRPAGVAAPSRDSALALARVQSPLVKVATSRTAAAEAAARAARAAWAPTLRLDGRLVTYGSSAGDYSTEWQTGARVSWPVLTGGGRGAAIERADAAVREARAVERDTELGIANEVDRTLATLTESGRRIAALLAAVGHLTEAQRVEALALDQGAGTQADFLRAEADLATARSGLAQARAAWIAARGDLARLTGMLSPDRLAQIASGSAAR